MFRNRTAASSSEVYTAAVTQAHETAEGFQNIRRNTMSATGTDAAVLAEIGALLMGQPTDKPFVPGDMYYWDYYQDFVTTGADVSFRMLQKVVDPAARRAGPGKFSIAPSDRHGVKLPQGPSKASPDFKNFPNQYKLSPYWLGEDRPDYWHAVAVGIAQAVTRVNTKPGKARTEAGQLAKGPDCYKYAALAVRQAADFTLEAVLATQRSGNINGAITSLYVTVEPVGSDSKDKIFNQAISLL